MAPRIRVLFDVNVVLDVLQRREPFYAMSARALAEAETGSIDGWLAAHAITTLFYLTTKYRSAAQARLVIRELLAFLSVAPVDQAIIEQALGLPYDDFEDAVQMMAAIQSGCQHLVTRNVAHFKAGPVPALQPVELLALL